MHRKALTAPQRLVAVVAISSRLRVGAWAAILTERSGENKEVLQGKASGLTNEGLQILASTEVLRKIYAARGPAKVGLVVSPNVQETMTEYLKKWRQDREAFMRRPNWQRWEQLLDECLKHTSVDFLGYPKSGKYKAKYGPVVKQAKQIAVNLRDDPPSGSLISALVLADLTLTETADGSPLHAGQQ